MGRDLCAIMRMEEKYIRMIVEYDNNDTKSKINEAIKKVEDKFSVSPSIIERDITDHSGNFSIEFEVESEIEHREAGEFCDEIMKLLDIKRCEN